MATREGDVEVIRQGLTFDRYFSTEGVHPFDQIEWETRDAVIPNFKEGGNAFEQRDVEFPVSWSQNATNIVAQKYFRGPLGTPQRESSVRQLVGRVVDTITGWGRKNGYFATEHDAQVFAEELSHLLVTQKAAFNSPVWFNVGVPDTPQQCSACQPYDAMVSTPEGLIPIGRLVEHDAVGTKVFDARGVTRIVATKANGVKEVLRIHTKAGHQLDVTADHLVWRASSSGAGAFVEAGDLRPGDKLEWHRREAFGTGEIEPGRISEAALAGWLQSDGFVGQYVGTNRSLTIEAMTVTDAELDWVTRAIDMVFPDVPRKETLVETQDRSLDCRRTRLYGKGLSGFVDEWGLRVRGAAMTVPPHLFDAPLPEVAAYLKSVFQAEGYVTIRGSSARIGLDMISEDLVRGVQHLLSRFGIFSRVRFKGDSRANRQGCWSLTINTVGDQSSFAAEIDFIDPRKAAKLEEALNRVGVPTRSTKRLEIERIERRGPMEVYDIQTESGEYLSGSLRVHNCFILAVEDHMSSILNWYVEEGTIFKGGSGSGINLSRIRSSKEALAGGGTASGPVSFMRGADASAGTIKSGGKTRRAAKMVILDVDHPDVRDFIWCKAHEEQKARALRDAGFDMDLDGKDSYSIQYQNANNSVRVTDEFMQAFENDADWRLKAVTSDATLETVRARDLMRDIAQAAWECADPGMQYDTTINEWHTCPATGRINASNPCSEYMHLDNSACNLASLNLMKFLDDEGTFDIASFRKAVEIVFTAQEIVVGESDYPTEKIGINARAFRQLGLGYANLGALLMARGLPYDSDQGRAWAGAITALMTGWAYRTSARIAEVTGPFEGYAPNADAMLRVMRKHRDAAEHIDAELVPEGMLSAAKQAWDEAISLGEVYGYRNAQASVLAPTGCLVGGSLVPTERGLVRLESLGDPAGTQWQDLGIEVNTDDGPRKATKFYVNGLEAVVTVETARGYRIQGTPRHRIRVVTEDGSWAWKRFSEIQPGDRVPLSLDQLVGEPQQVPLPPLPEAYWTGERHARAPRVMSPELAEFVGYFMGDGSLHAKGIRMCVDEHDLDVAERLRILGKELFGLEARVAPKKGYLEVAFNSVRLTLWWEACGFAKREPVPGHSGKGYLPHIPDAVLASNDRATYAAFVRGLFEADGTVTVGYPHWSTTSLDFSREVQSLMLALGFPTTRKMDVTDWGRSDLAVLRLLNTSYNEPFLEEIGFIGGRKADKVHVSDGQQAARHDRIPVSRAMVDRLAPQNDRLRRVMLMELARNGAVSRRLATELFERSADEELGKLLRFFYDEVMVADFGDDELTYDLSVPDNVTYIANGFVSHNTIGLMMDCDTTGIEPELALVKTKKLVGGGTMQFVNQTVPRALQRLGYTAEQIDDVVAYIAEHNSVVGAPHLREEHHPVFDTAMGDQPIHYMGHVRMMAAAQPFISGAISKTVNMPEHVTVEEVEQLFLESWKLGLKAVAIYRDNCKVAQPLSADKKKKAVEPAELAQPVRKRLPMSRPSRTTSFQVGDAEGYITAGSYPDDGLGEIFLKTSKQGSTLSGVMDAFAIAVSLGLQYGVPLEAYVSKFINTKFEPSGMTNDPDIRFATSLVDYVFRRLALDHLPIEVREGLGIKSISERTVEAQEKMGQVEASTPELPAAAPQPIELAEKPSAKALDAPLCYSCGSKMQPAGSCYVCGSCGSTSGCS
jgi:ribonucleoside-diphosphate reductase alpha chain